MDKFKFTRFHCFLIVALVWAGIYLPNLGKMELKAEEGRRVLPARTMLETGDYIVPYIGGEHYRNKPPGINWPVAISFKLTGVQNELTARIPTVITVLIFASMILFGRSRWLDLRGRFIACVIFLTNIAMIEKGRMIEIEGIYICLTGIAVLWWVNAFAEEQSKWSMWLVPGVVLGYSMLVKGPISVIVFYSVVISILGYRRKLKYLISPAHIVGLLLIVGITGLWYYLAAGETTGDAVSGELLKQMKSRIVGAFDLKELITHILKSAFLFMPWLLFIGALWDRKSMPDISEDDLKLLKGLRLGVVISFVALNLMPGSHPRYILPAYGPAALCLGLALSAQKPSVKNCKVWLHIIVAIAVMAGVASFAGLYFNYRLDGIAVAVVTVAGVIGILKNRKKLVTIPKLSAAMGVVIMLVVLQYNVFAVEVISSREKFRSFRETAGELVAEDETIYIYKSEYQPVLFYIREPMEYVSLEDVGDKKVKYLVTLASVLKELDESGVLSADEYTKIHDFPHSRRGGLVMVKIDRDN
jgi:4-amino-4-deoxy-L-arabinose transferase-like glycosyltransferase